MSLDWTVDITLGNIQKFWKTIANTVNFPIYVLDEERIAQGVGYIRPNSEKYILKINQQVIRTCSKCPYSYQQKILKKPCFIFDMQ